MSPIIMTQPTTKAAERARLSSFFDRLASHRPHAAAAVTRQAAIATDESLPTPQEFNTVLKNLYNLVQSKKTTRRSVVAWPHKLTADSMEMDEDNDEGDLTGESEMTEPSEPFPQAEEKKYPFTFKHMIHKLYKKDEWEKTVKDMLEKSKREYKPLAEVEIVSGPPGLERPVVAVRGRKAGDSSRRVSCGIGMAQRTRSSSGVGADLGCGTRRRSQSVVQGPKRMAMSPISPTFNIPPIRPTGVQHESMRAVKKRCVGKRKSISGLFVERANENVSSGNKGTWVFESTISSTENYIPGVYSPMSSPPESPVDNNFSGSKRRVLVDNQIGVGAAAPVQLAISVDKVERTTIKRRSLVVDTKLAKTYNN
ncbi:hypothetical protein CPB83DRAFT_862936 [Crepidotus variabilis]|uniref:Uncharacterized protein n=1 Tax=Crepidotus variabilis TaxID=179855 RepID=A0A9P6E6D1_9AGAR|nr:hypothetical protein CPB83DRAFT_862936 [Crepidotus variabilis]